jgi:hypothetical protein
MKQLKIGDTAYVPRTKQSEVKKECPVCCGTKQVTLIFGNGDSCVLPCENCKIGYEGPFGYITEYEFSPGAEVITITGIDTEQTKDGEKTTYRHGSENCWANYEAGNVFETQEEAVAKSLELKVAQEKEQSERAFYIKMDKNKSYSQNAGYHLRQAKRDMEQVEYHERMAVLCKSKAKQETP